METMKMDGPVVKHAALNAWIREIAELCQPERVHVCDGSAGRI